MSTFATRNAKQALELSPNFATSLRLALTGGGNHQSFGVLSNEAASSGIDIEFLDKYARTQWEGLLHYIVNSAGDNMHMEGEGPTASVRKLLVEGQLVEQRGRRVDITQAGFSFLLQEVNAQVWTLLIFYLLNAESVSHAMVCYNGPL